MPLASLAVRVTVVFPPTGTDAAAIAMVDFAGLGTLGTAVTVMVGAPVVTAWLFNMAVMVLVPATVAENVAVYVPSPLSVTAENVPWAVPLPSPNVTIAPPVVSGVPPAFRAVRVTVTVPPTATDVGLMETVDVAGLAGPVAGGLGGVGTGAETTEKPSTLPTHCAAEASQAASYAIRLAYAAGSAGELVQQCRRRCRLLIHGREERLDHRTDGRVGKAPRVVVQLIE